MLQEKTIWAVYFSPADGTRRVAVKIAERIADMVGAQVKEINFTCAENRVRTYEFEEKDFVIFASPVYAGRIPNKIMPDFKRCFVGKGAGAVALCTFGNRSFGGALDELHLILQQNGFRVVGKAAVVCQHVFSDLVGTGRPDAADWEEIHAFAAQMAKRHQEMYETECGERNAGETGKTDDFLGKPTGTVGSGSGNKSEIGLWLPADTVPEPYYTPLKTDGTPAKFLKAKPLTGEGCTDCGLCVTVCPMGSIDAKNPRLVSGVCIKCQACVRKCPGHAKYFTDEDFLSHVKMLEEHFTKRHKNEFIC